MAAASIIVVFVVWAVVYVIGVYRDWWFWGT